MTGIFLLSGTIRSGKTTRITEWISGKDDVNGILQPVINGRRHLKDIRSGEIRLLEVAADIDDEDIISVGDYKFSSQIFSWARDKLLSGFYSNPHWLIIDEFGKLELNNSGMEPAISSILKEMNDHPDTNIVFVIRDCLVADFLNKYGLTINDIDNLDL